jgi:serine/threonine protein kinase/tetratricopeptide (TPR) repeat protein
VRTGVDDQLRELMARALEKDPGLRRMTAHDLRTTLEAMGRLLTPATETARPEGLPPSSPDHQVGRQRRVRPPVVPGQIIGGYIVQEQIGSGAMGTVYRAHDRRLGRPAALKFLPREALDDDSDHDFVEEARSASALDHPNICTIYGIDEISDGDTFIAMAYYDGPSLAQRLQAGAMSPAEAADVALQIASGLAAAHSRGIVHCDIKPGNIMLTADGVVKIVDFGVSRIAGKPEAGVDDFVGTVGYAAPEQLRQEAFDSRVDIWAVGVVLYEMLSGRRPFAGSNLGRMLATVDREPPPLGDLASEVSPELEAVVSKALAKDPDERYQTADELRDELDQVITGESTRADDPGHRRLVRWGIAALVAVSAWVAGMMWYGEPTIDPGPGIGVAVAGVRDLGADGRWGWLEASVEELLRFELASRDQLRLTPVPQPLAEELLASPGVWAGDEPGQLAALAVSVQVSHALAGGYRVTPDAEEPLLHLSFSVQGPSARSGPATLGVDASVSDLVDAVAGIASQLDTVIGSVSPIDRPDPDTEWLPFGNQEAALLHRQAVARLRVLDSPTARDLLLEAIDLEPGNALHRLALADALVDLGRNEEAQQHIDAARSSAQQAPHGFRVFLFARHLDAQRERPRTAALYRALWADRHGLALPWESRTDAAVRLTTALVQAGRAEEALALVEQIPPDEAEGDPRLDLVRAGAYHWLDRHGEQLQAAQHAVTGATELAEPLLLARAQRLLAEAYWRGGQPGSGLEALAMAAQIYENTNQIKGLADVATMTGILHYEMGELAKANASYDTAARYYGILGNRRAEARTLTNRALVLEQQGDLEASIDVTRRALELFRATDDAVAELITLVNLSDVLLTRGQLADARRAFTRALELVEQVDRFEAWTLYRLSDLLVLEGDLSGAAARLDQAMRLQDESGDRVGHAETTARLATLRHLQGEVDEACGLFVQALPLIKDRGAPVSYASALRGHAEALRSAGDLENSSRALDLAMQVHSSVTARAGMASTQLAVAWTRLEQGALSEAEATARAALADLELRGAVVQQAMAHQLLAEIHRQRNDHAAVERHIDLARAALGDLEVPWTRLAIGLTASRARASEEPLQAYEDLQGQLAEATALGFGELELEARWMLGRLELELGHTVRGQERLHSVVEEARRGGLGLIAARAEQSLDWTAPESTDGRQ